MQTYRESEDADSIIYVPSSKFNMAVYMCVKIDTTPIISYWRLAVDVSVIQFAIFPCQSMKGGSAKPLTSASGKRN